MSETRPRAERANLTPRFASEDDNVGLQSAILASGASNSHCAISDHQAAAGRRHRHPRTVE
jgi:hypothetical protein